MKNCKTCGNQMGDDARFCTSCGADNGAAEPQQEYQPNTDYQPQPDTTAIPNNNQPMGDGTYYQPGNNYAAAPDSQFQQPPYQQMPYQQPPQKKKISGCGIALIVVGAIVALIIIAFIALTIFGYKILDKYPDILDDPEGFYEEFLGDYDYDYDTDTDNFFYGAEDSATYVNYSANLYIDITDSSMMPASYTEKRSYFGENADNVETFMYDPDTGESILVMLLQGSDEEAKEDLSSFVREIAESVFEGVADYKISDPYTRTIAGNEYTCIDAEDLFVYDDSSTTAEVYTFCFMKKGTQFFEIQFIAYPEETGNTADTMIADYISEAN